MVSVIASIILSLFFIVGMPSSSQDESNSENENDHSMDDRYLKKGPWTAEEDAILAAYVTENGIGNWNIVRKNTGLSRCGKSCRLRWTNHLRPDLKKGAFTDEEQRKIIELHASMGNKWARMAQELPGRTDNEIKNFWNTRQKKRKRIGLPLYPDDIKPVLNIENSQTQNATDSHEAGTSSNVPELVFNPYYTVPEPPLYIPPISVIPENTTSFEQQVSDNQVDYKKFQDDHMSCGNVFSSDTASSISELPPFPSFEDSFRVREDPLPPETYYEPRSPGSNGYLESVFYPPPPETLEEQDHCSTQGELSSGNKENSEQTNVVNQDALSDFNWEENHNNDYYLKDTLYGLIYPFL